jgi:hypothetical protein
MKLEEPARGNPGEREGMREKAINHFLFFLPSSSSGLFMADSSSRFLAV